MSGSVFVLPANRAALVIRGSGFETLAALNGHGDPWITDIRSVLTSSAQRRGTINDVPHIWIALQVAPQINEQITPAPGIEILPAGGEILLPDDTAREWTQALKTGKSIQAAPIKKSSLEDFARWVHDRVAANDPPCEPPPAEHEAADPRPIIDDEAIDNADAHAIISVLRLNGIEVPEELESLPLPELREDAKKLARSPEAHEAARTLKEEDQRAKKERNEKDAYMRFALRAGTTVRLDNAAVGAFVRDRLHTITFNGTVYLYDDGSGLYREDAGQINGLIQRIAETVGFNGSITSAKREILSYVRDHNVAGEYPFNRHPNALPLANGVLEIDLAAARATLHPYTPEYRFTQRWPVVYDDKADPTPTIEILRQYVDDEAVPEHLGDRRRVSNVEDFRFNHRLIAVFGTRTTSPFFFSRPPGRRASLQSRTRYRFGVSPRISTGMCRMPAHPSRARYVVCGVLVITPSSQGIASGAAGQRHHLFLYIPEPRHILSAGMQPGICGPSQDL